LQNFNKNGKKQLFSLPWMKQVGELLEVYDDENEMDETLVMIHEHLYAMS
jgi:hypothetical protein